MFDLPGIGRMSRSNHRASSRDELAAFVGTLGNPVMEKLIWACLKPDEPIERNPDGTLNLKFMIELDTPVNTDLVDNGATLGFDGIDGLEVYLGEGESCAGHGEFPASIADLSRDIFRLTDCAVTIYPWDPTLLLLIIHSYADPIGDGDWWLRGLIALIAPSEGGDA